MQIYPVNSFVSVSFASPVTGNRSYRTGLLYATGRSLAPFQLPTQLPHLKKQQFSAIPPVTFCSVTGNYRPNYEAFFDIIKAAAVTGQITAHPCSFGSMISAIVSAPISLS